MPKFIVDIWLDGYDTDEEVTAACEEFILDSLDMTASSVKVTRIANDTPQFEEDGLRLFKPASYVIAKTNESIYNSLTKKYNLPSITHRIALAIDEMAEYGIRNLDVVFESSEIYNYSSDTAYFSNIMTYDHESIYQILKRELNAVGGYIIHQLRIDNHAGISRFKIEW